MPKAPSQPRAPERDRRDDILEAALALFAERGFHGTAVPEVAARARVGAGTIYRYFPSKEALVNKVYWRWKTALAHAVMQDFPFHAPAREQFQVFWRRAVAFAVEHPLAFKFLELHHHAPYLDAESRRVEEEVVIAAVAFFAKTRQDQVTKDLDPQLLMAIVWGGVVGLVKNAWEGRLALSERVIADAESCCWEAVRR